MSIRAPIAWLSILFLLWMLVHSIDAAVSRVGQAQQMGIQP